MAWKTLWTQGNSEGGRDPKEEGNERSCSGWAEGVGGKGTPGGVSSEKVRKGIHSKTRGKRMEMEESIGIYTKS